MIKLENIEKYYDRKKESEVYALRGMSLEIEKGETVAVMGVSGSGKSTLLHILGLMDTFDSGKYFFDGKDVSCMRASEKALIRNRSIGFVMQDYGLIFGQTALENVMLPLLLNKETPFSSVRQRALFLLDRVGMKEKANIPARKLSGGQQQRVAIARAMANEPLVLIADEPTGALDTATSKEVLEILSDLNRENNTTIIIATHDIIVRDFCRRALYISDGTCREMF